MAHEQGALVGYVHPFDSFPRSRQGCVTYAELPADVALAKSDYIEVVGFSDHKSTAEVWYKLLNCGFRLPTASGTDFMGNYASLRGPVGLNRVYAEGETRTAEIEPWLASIKRAEHLRRMGRCCDSRWVGRRLAGKCGSRKNRRCVIQPSSSPSFRSITADRLQRQGGAGTCSGSTRTSAACRRSIPIEASGWCVLRAFSDKAEYPILDIYPYATTSPCM